MERSGGRCQVSIQLIADIGFRWCWLKSERKLEDATWEVIVRFKENVFQNQSDLVKQVCVFVWPIVVHANCTLIRFIEHNNSVCFFTLSQSVRWSCSIPWWWGCWWSLWVRVPSCLFPFFSNARLRPEMPMTRMVDVKWICKAVLDNASIPVDVWLNLFTLWL